MPSAQPSSPELLPSSARCVGAAWAMRSGVPAGTRVPRVGSGPGPARRAAGDTNGEVALGDGSRFAASAA